MNNMHYAKRDKVFACELTLIGNTEKRLESMVRS